ncbi:hypothetical protein JCM10450v2_002522 [Rhodotorula kratochvilovae]
MSTPATKPAAELALPTATLDKYKAAAGVVESVVKQLIEKAVEGANILELCQQGDKLVEEGVKPLYNKAKGTAKGIAFPTTLSVNNVLQNFSPALSDKEAAAQTLKKDDVVKIVVGAHIDGYPVVSGETIVVGASGPITGLRANLLAAAYQAGEVALRAVKPGVRNWEVTEAVKSLLKEYEATGVKGLEGTLSHQFAQNNLEAKKGLVAFPTAAQRSDSENAYNFEEGEVYGLNILVTDGERSPKTADTARTTIFSKTQSTYLLKMKTSRATFSEISTKAGSFPFTLRIMEDETRARMGVKECVQHNLVRGYDLLTTEKPENLSAQVFITFTVTKTGAARLSSAPVFYAADKVQSDVELSDKTKETLARPLKAKPQKKKKAAAEEK